jgi:NAD(P)-dependent dehydrogenase (short-subunit alcohol dehydrogenase family)
VTRTALVTGANRGIGLEVCRRLLELDHRVVLAARDEDLGRDAAAGLSGDVRVEQLDISDPVSVSGCAQRLARAGIDVDVLVNNAGLYTTTPLLRVDEPAMRDALEVNFIGAWRTCRAWVPGMRDRGWGRVVSISTGRGGLEPSEPPFSGAYGLGKAGLQTLTRMVAAEAGPAVKVNAMSPGWVATRMGGAGAPVSVEEGADTAVFLATLPDDGPTDSFFYRRERVAW